jgi:seryl-tRNA synthetase
MNSINKIRENIQHCREKLLLKNDNSNLDKIVELDKEVRSLKTVSGEIRAERNSASEMIAETKKSGGDATKAIMETRKLGDDLKVIEKKLKLKMKSLKEYLYKLPNLPHDSVPQGKDEKENVVVRTWGDTPKFNFNPKTHIELGNDLRLFDFERAAKISGSGFSLYTGKGAHIERALINLMIDHHTLKFNFEEIFPPVLMRKESMITTGQLPKFEEDMYHTELDNLYLAPTAEVPITNIHRDEIIDGEKLPIYYVSYTPCFRRESGSYGKDTRGLLRMHQFNKVELVKFTKPSDSYSELESLTEQAESLLQKLGLRYRVIELCTGDLSFAAAKCYDLEVWAPGENKWLEVSSCSNFESFQARRGNIRFRDTRTNKVDFLHTLNGSGLATPRLLVALLETYQTDKGTIKFPEKIAKFLGIEEIV